MGVTFEPVERVSVSEEIAKRVLDLINTGVLKPGDKLPSERELMDQLRVSRSSIREALRSLSMMGVLEIRPGAGTYVTEHLVGFIVGQLEWTRLLGKRNIIELLEVREPLEIHAAGLAAQRATPYYTGLLYAAIETYSDISLSLEKRMEADIHFHDIIAEMSGNSVLEYLLRVFHETLRNYALQQRIGFSTATTAEDEHLLIVEAIESGDELRARAAMAQHLRTHRPVQLSQTTATSSSHAASIPHAATAPESIAH